MPEYPPIGGEITEEMMDQATEKRNEAMSAMSEGICIQVCSDSDNLRLRNLSLKLSL